MVCRMDPRRSDSRRPRNTQNCLFVARTESAGGATLRNGARRTLVWEADGVDGGQLSRLKPTEAIPTRLGGVIEHLGERQMRS